MNTSKTALVTGAGGFIGSHLVERLVASGYKVRAFVRYNSRNDWGWLENSPYKNEVEVFQGDIVNFDCVHEAVGKADLVFHLAALIGIPYSYVTPLSYIRVNVEGTYNVLQAARMNGNVKVVLTSTSEVYGTAIEVPISENHPLQPQSPYSASKISADNLALSYYNSFGLPIVVVRPFNTYGPRQSLRAVIPTIVTQAAAGKNTIQLGSLHPTRDLNYVSDTAESFVRLAECDKAVGEVVNVCSKAEISIGDLANLISSLMGKDLNIESSSERTRPEASEVERLYGDNKKLVELTGWRPTISLNEGLRETIDWFREGDNLSLYKPDFYNI